MWCRPCRDHGPERILHAGMAGPSENGSYHISADEVITSLQKQNIAAAPGKVGENIRKDIQSAAVCYKIYRKIL